MRHVTWIAGLIIAFTIAGGTAFAQSGGEGVLNAVSYRPMPADSTIRVQALDNSDANLALVEEVKQALTTRGYQLSDDGGMILTIETRDEIGAWSTTDRRHVLEIEGQTASHSDDAQVKLNIFDSESGGILNEGNPGTSIMTPSQYIVEFSIDNASNGKRMWQAWASADLGQFDSLDLMRGMIPALSDSLGKTISKETFRIQ